MQFIGLTGGIACGKSTVSAMLIQEGFPVIDCDEIARDVVRKGRWGYHRVVKAFAGQPIIRSDGELDREALARIAFSDPAARRHLNSATHIPVLVEILRQAARHWLAFRPAAVVDMPLLFETGFFRVTRPTVLVACSPNVQLERLQRRDGLDQAAAEARLAAQMPLERKLALADVVVRNDGSVEELQRQVGELAGRLRRRAWLHRTLLSPAGVALAVAMVARAVL